MSRSMFSNNVVLETSTVGEVSPMKKVGSFSTVQIEQSPINFELPESTGGEVITLDMDDLFITPDNSNATNGSPLGANDNSNNTIAGGNNSSSPEAVPMSVPGLGSGATAGSDTFSVALSSPGSGSGSVGGSSSGDAGVSVGDGSAIGGNSANGTDARFVYAEDAEYTAPYVSTADIDIEGLDLLALTPEELQSLLGKMDSQQYADFIAGVQRYYDGQLSTYDALLHGNGDQVMGYIGCLDWVDEFLEDHQLLTHTPEDELNQYDWQQNDLLDRINYSFNDYAFNNAFPNADISRQEFLQLDRDEQWQFLLNQNYSEALTIVSYREAYLKNLNQLVAEEFGDLEITTYEDLMALRKYLSTNIEQINQAIELTNRLKKSAWYDYLEFLDDYNNYEIPTFTQADLDAVEAARGLYNQVKQYNYDDYHYTHPDVDPIQYYLMVHALNPNSDNYEIVYLQNPGDIEAIMAVYDVCPKFAKTYSYLYSIDPAQAKQYLQDCKYEFNSIRGQMEAQAFLSILGEKDGNYDGLEAIANTLGVTVEGLMDGLEGFGEGVYYSLEALGTALGLCEENRVPSVEEYKKMYILQALLPQETKEAAGLIIKNEDGTYSNNPDANPYGFIDFTTNYSGLWLNHKYQISQGIGNMGPSILLSMVNPAAGMWALGVSAGGNAYHSAMVDGKSYTNALFYGLFTGSSEAVTERLLGGLPGLSEVKVTSFRTYLRAMGREGFQETFQGAMDYLYKAMFMGEPLPDITDVEGWKAIGKDLLQQGSYGAITAGILQSGFAFNLQSQRRFNNFMIQNEISLTQQQEAINLIRNANEQLANLSDAEIIAQYGQMVATQAMVNKVVDQYNVNPQIANIMLAFNVDSYVANFMLENHVTLEEAINVENTITREFLEAYVNDSNIEIPDYIPAELKEYLEHFKENPEITPPLHMPKVLEDFVNDYRLQQRASYDAEFQDRVAAQRGKVEQFLSNNGTFDIYWFTMKMNASNDPIAYMQALLDIAEEYSNNNTKPILDLTDMEGLRAKIEEFQSESSYEISKKFELLNTLDSLQQLYLSNGYVSLVNAIASLSDNPNLVLDYNDTYGLTIGGLEPNSVYAITYEHEDFMLNEETGDYDIPSTTTREILVRTNSDGIGYIPELYTDRAARSWYMRELPNDIKITSFELSNSTTAFDPNNPNYLALAAAGELGVNQHIFSRLNFFNSSVIQDLYQRSLAGFDSLKMNIAQQTVQLVKSYFPSLSNSNIIRFLQKVDSEGACSYASVSNMMALQFRGKEALFKQVFGYDLYRIENGQKVLNSELMLADLYTFINLNNKSMFKPGFFSSVSYLNPKTHAGQFYPITSNGIDQAMIQRFFDYKIAQSGLSSTAIDLSVSHCFSYFGSANISRPVPQQIYNTVTSGMYSGTSFSLEVFVRHDINQQLKMFKYNPETGLHDIPWTSDAWFSNNSQYEAGLRNNESAGHAMTILQATEEGLYVQSWGDTYFVPYSSLDSIYFSIDGFMLDINN